MSTPATATETGRATTTTYPIIPEETWWRLRKQFKEKQPPRVLDEDYVIDVLDYTSEASAKNLLRPLRRIGLIGDDGKPTDLAYSWREDDEYPAVCKRILEDVYLQSMRDAFSGPGVDRSKVEGWFSRNLRVGTHSARQYAAFYMLLLEADPSKQEATAAKPNNKAPKTAKAAAPQRSGARSRSRGAKVDTSSSSTQGTPASDTAHMSDGHEAEHHQATPRRAVRSFEPSLNINVQIHLPAEATPAQIDQIFESMAKHLYQRRDEVGE